MQYPITYSCGHTGVIELYGKSKDREYFFKRAESGLCPECEAAERAQFDAAFAKERELPELKGTERQVAWANTIRRTAIQLAENLVDRCKHDNRYPDEQKAEIEKAFQFLCRKDNASFWIDNRDKSSDTILQNAYNDLLQEEAFTLTEAPEKEVTVSPEDVKKEGIARIRIKGDFISFLYPKDGDFMRVVKAHGCKWSGSEWAKKVTAIMGTVEDIAAEIGRHLLDEGFMVAFPDESIRDMAVNGTYEKEHTRWVLRQDDKKVKLKWQGRDESLYSAATRLKGAKYRDGVVLVPADYYNCIEDFAEVHDFYISPKAREVLDSFRARIENIDVVKLRTPEVPESPETDLLAELTEED